MKSEQQSVLHVAPRHVAVFNIGAYWEMNNSFSKEFQETKAERGNKNPKIEGQTTQWQKRTNNDLQSIRIKLTIV